MFKKLPILTLTISLIVLSQNVFAKKEKQFSLEQLVEMKSVVDVAVSPNGEHFAYLVKVPRDVYSDDDGKPYVELYVTDQEGNSRPFITGKKRLGSIQWGANGRFIYFLSQRDQDKFASVYKIAVDGGEAQSVVSGVSDISSFSVNYDESKLVYLAKPKAKKEKESLKKKGLKAKVYEESVEFKSAYLVDLLTPKSVHIKLDNEAHFISAKFHPNKDRLLIRTAPTPFVDDSYVASEYQIAELDGDLLSRFKTEGKLGVARWSPDGEKVAIIGAQDKHDPATGRLYIGDASSGKLREINKNYQGQVRDIQWQSDFQLTFLGHVGTQSEVVSINLDSGTHSAKITKGDLVVHSIRTDKLGRVLVGVASSDAHPSEIVNFSDNQTKRQSVSNPWLELAKLPKQETITFKARDGVEIQGVLIYPMNYSKRKRYPLIMMVHGGPESHVSDAWLDRYSYPIKYAAERDYAVFLPNYRGSTGRGVEFSKMGQADYAGAEFNDLVDAIKHLSDIGLVDKKRVGITGGSYGGYASAWAATALSEHFAASVMFVGISNQLSKFGTTDIPKEMHNVHARNYPWDKWQWMLERSPIYHTDKAKTPLLIMHGEKDTRVHPSQSMELYRYIKTRTDTPVRLVFYPDEGHGNKNSASQLDYSMRLMRWMNFYLKGKSKGKKMPSYELNHAEKIESADKNEK